MLAATNCNAVNLFPIVSRELLVASRRLGTYASRFAIALLVFFVIGYFLILLQWDNVRLHQAGAGMFFGVSGILIFLCNIAGIYLTADCLSEEKRNGTLGLLFLTNLRGYQVVFGKMSVGAIQGVLGLLAAVPMLVVPVLMGGVDPALVLRMVGVLFATLVLSLSVGIACSAMFKSSKVTAGVTLAVMVFLNFGAPLIYGIVYEIDGRSGRAIQDILLFSTGNIYVLTLDGGFGPGGRQVTEFKISLALVLGVAAVLMIFTLWKTGRAWQDQPAAPAMDTARGDRGKASRRRARVLDANPLVWLTVRRRSGPLLVWITVIGVFTFLMAVNDGFESLFSNRNYGEGSFLFTLWAIAAILKWWMAGAVCDRFRLDRGENALELLLSTPLEYEDYARAHRQRLIWQFLWPGVLMLCFIPFMMAKSDHDTWPVYILGVLMFLADVWAVYFVGMHTSLSLRRPELSSTIVILKIYLLPFTLFLIAMLMIAITNSGTGVEGVMALWFMIGLVNNAVWVGRACMGLGEQFRETAARAVSPGS